MASAPIIQTSIFLAPATALFIAGYSYSAGTTVSLLSTERPHHSTPLFSSIFYSGGAVVVPVGLLSSSLSAYLAYLCTSPRQRNLYAFAAVSVFSSLPWTRLVMYPGIQRLIEISGSEKLKDKTEQTLEARQLMGAWVRQNSVRCVLFASGGAAALWAAVFG